ncbi:MAG: T9SS type A sorting domain-containing protein [Prevotellaceae bacterium]|jgi:thiol-disulfide isomerase/thioredoxin|nr:T9SS type A sorting domain-containing protein [Prevotellaceae bacterium]
MKKLVSLVAVILALSITVKAQLPANSIAKDFKVFEIDKTNGLIITSDTIHLYEFLDAGKPVFIDFSATWCGPCWAYHQTHAMKQAFENYGPDGTDELRVLWIEGDMGNCASLTGTGRDAGGNATQGDWLSGTPYPVIPLNMAPNKKTPVSNYAIGYWPTLYMVCPNRMVNEVGGLNAANIRAAAQACPNFPNNMDNNAAILYMEPIQNIFYCEGGNITPTIRIQNTGSTNLTTAQISIDIDGTEVSTYDWSGNLPQWNMTNVTLPAVSGSTLSGGTHTLTISVTQANGVNDTEPTMNSISQTFEIQTTGISSAGFSENFEGDDFPPAGWYNDNGLLFTYNGAVFFYAYDFDQGVVSELTLPMLNFQGVTSPAFTFSVAYSGFAYGGQTYAFDRLEVRTSVDCGTSWQVAYDKTGADLQTTNSTASEFIPTSSQWRTDAVDISELANQEQALIQFKFTSGYGNVVWIDNVAFGTDNIGIKRKVEALSTMETPEVSVNSPQINMEVKKLKDKTESILFATPEKKCPKVNASAVKVGANYKGISSICSPSNIEEIIDADFAIYPNPVTDILNIQSNEPIKKVEIFNLLGQVVKAESYTNSVNMARLSTGIYTVKVTTDAGVNVQKVVKK